MERNNSDLGWKAWSRAEKVALGKATATITMGRCLELKDSATRERALEIPGSPNSWVLMLTARRRAFGHSRHFRDAQQGSLGGLTMRSLDPELTTQEISQQRRWCFFCC